MTVAQRWAVTCKGCGGAAFVVLGDLPKPTSVVTAARCQHLDGRPLAGDEPLVCDTCGIDFTRTGVAPASEWKLLAEPLVQQAHNPLDMPFGGAADPRDIASVRLALASRATPPKPRRARRASPRHPE